MEPSPETKQEIGTLCMAWAFLESVTETTLWGVVDATEKLGPLITSRLDMRSRWQMILEYAPVKHDTKAVAELKGINKDLVPITRDRNIIVHGLVHAHVIRPPDSIYGDSFGPGHDLNYIRKPCWAVFRGAGAGKVFPMSSGAVEIVRKNIQSLAERVIVFNKRHAYELSTQHTAPIEQNWPTPLE